MNRQFRVVSLAILIKGNKMAKSGEIVKEGQLIRSADELVKEGHIKLLTDSKEDGSIKGSNESNDSDNSDKTPLFVIDDEDGKIEVFSEDDLNKKQIVNLLKAKEIAFDPTKNKTILFEILLDTFK